MAEGSEDTYLERVPGHAMQDARHQVRPLRIQRVAQAVGERACIDGSAVERSHLVELRANLDLLCGAALLEREQKRLDLVSEALQVASLPAKTT